MKITTISVAHLLCIILLSISCSSSKSTTSLTKDHLERVDLGRDDTAIIGKVLQYDDDLVTMSIYHSKQGGASAPILTSNTSVELLCTPIFKRTYLAREGKSVDEVLKIGQEYLLIVNQSIKEKNLLIKDIITTSP